MGNGGELFLWKVKESAKILRLYLYNAMVISDHLCVWGLTFKRAAIELLFFRKYISELNNNQLLSKTGKSINESRHLNRIKKRMGKELWTLFEDDR